MCIEAYAVHVEEGLRGSSGVSGECGEDIGIDRRRDEDEGIWVEEVLIVDDGSGGLL
jgi:hypothetical protein